METRFSARVSVLVLVSSLLYPAPYLQNETGKSQEMQVRKSLIRKELLLQPEESLAPPKRNIFTRQRGNRIMDEISPSEALEMPGQRPQSGQPELSGRNQPPVDEFRADVKYIGYVRSGDRIVALIVFGNEIYAVQSGDVLETGLTIGEITPEDMEIFDGGPEPRRIILEGEKP